MRIFVINWQDIRNPMGGGAEVHCHEIFKRIAAMGHSVTLLCCGFDGAPQSENIDGIRVVRIASRNTFNFHVRRYYEEHVRGSGYEVVVDDINKIPFYTPRYVKEPVVAIAHHFFGRSIFRETDPLRAGYVAGSEALIRFVYGRTRFAAVSESTRAELEQKGIPSKNISIVRNALNHEQFPMAVTAKEAVPVVAYFGRMKKYKSPDHLLRAFADVVRHRPEAQCWFLGGGDFTERLRTLARDLGIASSVTIFGRVSDEQKADLLSRSWCMVNTSMKEGWGITNIEANACGTPVIAANVPGLRDSVSDQQSGLLYPYGNIPVLAAMIERIFSDDALRERLSTGAVQWARSFSWDAEAKKMLDVLESVRSSSDTPIVRD
ncbi:MAG: glycosyltransferase family 4 protein [Candidatus Kapaibacterium sp.]